MFTNIKNMNELFEIELRYAYDCEKKLVEKGLPSMIEAAQSPELRTALELHLEETRGQLRRLETAFATGGLTPETKSNRILSEIMDAAKDSAGNIESPEIRDAALIANGNMVEHYEIALYGTLVAWARQLGFDTTATLLEQTLQEEKAADAKLTQLASSSANVRAARAQAARR
ncbi:MAG: ferritin-like domain-containing protein [Candidatus Acidiferrales bacterium]